MIIQSKPHQDFQNRSDVTDRDLKEFNVYNMFQAICDDEEARDRF